MMNAKDSLLEIIGKLAKVKCALVSTNGYRIDYDTDDDDNLTPKLIFKLKVNYTEQEWLNFLDSIDEWDEYYGTIWLEDGSWLEVEEYDCRQSWKRVETQVIPNELLN